MRVKIDKPNKVVIAEKYFKGKKIRAIARCKEEDMFDEDFGEELAEKKLEIKIISYKIKLHQDRIKEFNHVIKWIDTQIKGDEKLIDILHNKLLISEIEHSILITDKYREEK